ncbi:MAG: M1 family metallopeptidase [Chitinophagaceae bacterium]|nr:M1 family metallopeptidase [Chitinophagaceae bacterium]
MIYRFLLCFLLLASNCAVIAQDLFMPRDVQKAFKKGTRSPDGKPGKNYWQNHARYAMTITVQPPSRTIRGSETITYYNNSPDTLRNANIKLFLNIHKPGAPRNIGSAPDYLTSGVHIDAYAVNGQKVPWPSGRTQFTNQYVRLPKPLLPHDSIQFSFDWHYEISLESGREGMIDSTTYFLAYFYPRVAVYDDYNGWDRINFVDSHEFYSDFNDYTVNFNVPANYLVWGTGTLTNPAEVLQPTYLSRYQSSLTSDEVIRVVTPADLSTKNITKQNAMNTWQFKTKNIPDVTFGVSDHYVWDAGSVIVDSLTRRRASAQAAYNDTAKDYHQMVEFTKHSLAWFSKRWPGVAYPYEKFTVFQGYADMEYPMMANNSTFADPVFSRFVAEHEIAHTYMPFYMGINETRYGFMDEGWATTFELLIGYDDLGKDRAEAFYRQFRVQGWTNSTAPELLIPVITPADAMSGGAGTNMYGKASLGYLAMKDLLGDQLFKKCLHEFMNRWNGKHPLPWDMFNTFNNVAGKNLNWLWNNWFFSSNHTDLAIESVQKSGAGYSVSVKNIGGFFAPVDLVIKYTDGSTETKHIGPAAWEKNAKQAMVTITTRKKLESVQLKGGVFMDADEMNNTIKTGEKKGF